MKTVKLSEESYNNLKKGLLMKLAMVTMIYPTYLVKLDIISVMHYKWLETI